VVLLTALYIYERSRRRDCECARTAAESARKVLGLELERMSKIAREAERQEGRLKARVLNGIAERLRRPIGEITDRLRSSKRLSYACDTEVREFESLVRKETAELEGLVESLLDLAALEADTVQWCDSEVDVEAVIGRAVTRVDAAALRSGVTVETQVDGPFPPIYGDSGRLAQVLGNLLDNAIKVSPTGAVVTTSACVDGSGVAFSISDGGGGMTDEELDRLLDNLDRVGVALERHSGEAALGIGLAVCRLIVRRHGGRFWSETRAGEGSEFGFTIGDKHETTGED